jgi:hypothetical protein
MDEQPKSLNADPVWQEPTEDMLLYVNSEAGVCSVKDIRWAVSKRFPAGAYVITCTDVTKGLPAHKQMKTVKILMKLVDLTEPEQPEDPKLKKPEAKKPAGKK